MSQKYVVEVVERLVRSVCVSAESEADALEKVEALYNDSEIVLTADDFADVDFEVVRTLPKYLVKYGDNANVFDEPFDTYEDAIDYFQDKLKEEFAGYGRKSQFETLRIKGEFVELWSGVEWIEDEDGNPIENGCEFIIRYNVEEYREHLRKLEEDEE